MRKSGMMKSGMRKSGMRKSGMMKSGMRKSGMRKVLVTLLYPVSRLWLFVCKALITTAENNHK